MGSLVFAAFVGLFFYLESSWTLPMCDPCARRLGRVKALSRVNMSEQPPRTPFTPIYAPKFSRDANGNILYRDAQGRWLPYNGPLPNQQQAMPEYTAQQLGHVPLNDKSRGGPNSPIEHAFAPQPEYQFTLRPVQSGTPQAPIPIDPALLPLPGGADLDLRDGPTIANAMGLNRAEKALENKYKQYLRQKKPTGSYRSHKRDPGVERVDGKIRYPSTDDYDESDEENHNPWDTFDVPHRSRSHHTGSRRPISRRRTPSAGPSRRRISRRRTPTPGPSRLPALLPSPSPPPAPISIPHSANAVDTHVPVSLVTGRAVELVVTPQRGPAVALVISPTKQPNTFNGNK
ncbi:hypothetical protein MVEN_00498900 [Mycena venus]|uniref:Uncharacterized protein n=1 Tax=Mycena venus TaxID=2733690 RepID=A0A8H6YWH9_9AGAR|nr:hypothetical protein MVEN_00498900 [Mycena venus]